MANNTEVIFEDIEQRIIKEINNAHYAIFVSVAWFTNKKLFNALLEKAKQNCYVSIIIQLDEINSQCGIDYSQIQIGRSECFKISKDAELLHDKFCVVDFKKVITGSYNWTYKASHNSENILILNDPTVATQYISRFEQQKAKFQESSIQQKSVTSVSSNIVNISTQTTTIPKSVVVKEAPKVKLCSHCNKELGYNDGFCKHCGRQQKDFHYMGHKLIGIKRQATCKKCSHKQEEDFLDAMRTKYCTFCGSDKLEWKSILIIN
jgi:hypothetical protein